MNGTNEVIFSGVIGKDPKVVGANLNVMKFTLAVGRNQKKNPDGTWSGETDWVQCVFFGNDTNLKKGTPLKVWGQFRNNHWEKDGVKRYDYQINVDAYRIFQKKQTAPQQAQQEQEYPPARPDIGDGHDGQGDSIPF